MFAGFTHRYTSNSEIQRDFIDNAVGQVLITEREILVFSAGRRWQTDTEERSKTPQDSSRGQD